MLIYSPLQISTALQGTLSTEAINNGKVNPNSIQPLN